MALRRPALRRILQYNAVLAVSGVLTAAGATGVLAVVADLPTHLSLVGGLALGHPAFSFMDATAASDSYLGTTATAQVLADVLVLVAAASVAGVATVTLATRLGVAATSVVAALGAGATIATGHVAYCGLVTSRRQ